MSRPCPDRQELLQLLDGEATENRSAELRAHLSECRRCAREYDAHEQLVADLSAPVPGVPSPGAAQVVMSRLDSRLDSKEASVQRARSWRPWLLGAGGLATAAALALVAVSHDSVGSSGFTARGASAQWTKKVGVELWALQPSRRKLAGGEVVAPDTAFVASYRNLDAAPAYLLAFALDARGELHWLYPAYEDPRADPQAVRLEPDPEAKVFPDSVVLEDVIPGPLRILTVISRAPLSVSSIEALPASQRMAGSLRSRWPQARIEELLLRVEAASPEGHESPAPRSPRP